MPEGGPHPLVYAPLPQLPVSFHSSRGGGGGSAGGGGGGGGSVAVVPHIMSHMTQMKCIATSSALPSATLTVMVSVAPIVGFSWPSPPPGRACIPPPPAPLRAWRAAVRATLRRSATLEAFVVLPAIVHACASSLQSPSSGVPSS